MKRYLRVLILAFGVLLNFEARAQTTEDRFQDLFVTAGYCTAFGAAIGTALLAWTGDPSANLKYVAVGASAGFLGGSLLGTYVIFSPMIGSEGDPIEGLAADGTLDGRSAGSVVVRPTWDREKKKLTALEGGVTLATF